MPVREHLIQTQRNLYDRFRTSARQSLGNLSPALRKYFIEYQREFTDYQNTSSYEELFQAFLESDILICGDYHTLPQAQRTVLELLKGSYEALIGRGRKPVLALEMLRNTDTQAAARYLRGDLGETKFLQVIGFNRNWGFSWENYRPLFEFAREKGIEVVGLNTTVRTKSSLAQRDRFAAGILADLVRKNPQVTALVLIGDLHLAASHLPAALQKRLGKRSAKTVLLHQNPERLYWKLASRGLEHQVNVLRLKEGVYCVMNTPPWVKLQSYLRWVEGNGDFDSQETPASDYTDDFLDLVRTIQSFVGFEHSIDDSVTVLWRADAGIEKASSFEERFQRKLLDSIGSYFVPGDNTVLLPKPHINSAAAQAAIYLHAKLSGRWKRFQFPRQDFYSVLWIEALGFLGSKVINPHRRGYTREDFKSASGPIAKWVAAHLKSERFGIRLPATVLVPERGVFYYRAARWLGQMLGNALYSAVLSNRVTSEELQSLFRNPFTHGKEARDLYLAWISRLESLT